MKLHEVLPEKVKELLSESSMETLEDAIKEKIDLAVESALVKQDDLYSEKLVELMESLDKDRAIKFKKALQCQEKSATKKIKRVIRKYEHTLNEEAKNFKDSLVATIDSYIDIYLEDAIPVAAIEEATKNNMASNILESLRKTLAVDSALMNEQVKEGLVDGKNQIEDLRSEVEKLRSERDQVMESYNRTATELMLEQKTSKLPTGERDYLKRVLCDKEPQFIQENFDYTLKLFRNKEKGERKVLKEQAYRKRVVKDKPKAPKHAEKIVHESSSKVDPYLAGLDRMK